MNYESINNEVSRNISSSSDQNISQHNPAQKSSKIDNIAFYVFLISFILAPIAFWWSSYVSLDMIKTFVISMGVIVSAIILSFVAIKEKSISLPPKILCSTSLLLLISITISSFLSLHFGKSFFGQVFEVSNASFIILLFLSGLVIFNLIVKQKDRALVLYFGMVSTYIILFLLHLSRIIFGNDFMNLGVLTSPTSTIFGSWYGLSTLSSIVLMVSILVILSIKLSSKMKWVFWLLTLVSSLGVIFIGDIRVWYVSSIVFIALTVLLGIEKFNLAKKNTNSYFTLVFKSIPIIPFIVSLVFILLITQGSKIVGPLISKMGIVHSEIFLPWQTTLEVTSATIQNYPLFGVGSNGFSQAYLAYKPIIINSTEAWGTEFSYGLGLIPTFIASHGVIGSILWILLFVFFGIIATKILKNLPFDGEKRFMLVSSLMVSVFLWILSFITIPSHTLLLYTFVFTSVFVSLAVSYGIIPQRIFTPRAGSVLSKIFASIVSLFVLLLVVWGLVYIKKTLAFVYFGSAIKEINTSKNIEKADLALTKAIKLDESDAFWRGKAEVSILIANQLASTITPSTNASTTQSILSDINTVLNKGLANAKNATKFDPKNYYNYLSEARVSELAADIKMKNGYENALEAYNKAINLNPYNPSLYYALASFEARNSKYDEALRDLGKALQVKNNYLDAIFLLSQIYATKGDLRNAITAADVAVQLNPQNSVLLFQLGLLKYNNKDYAGASQALTESVKIQPDYANAKYFLGLSEARLNNTGKAITLFEDLAKSNPDNQEIALVLSNLRSGRSIFNDAKPPVSTAPEKRSSLPIKEK